MLSANAYLGFVGGAVRTKHGSFTVIMPDREEVFPAGKAGALYLYFEEKLAQVIPVVTVLGPIAGNVATTKEVVAEAKQMNPEMDPASAIIQMYSGLTVEEEAEVEEIDFQQHVIQGGTHESIKFESAAQLKYLETENPEGVAVGSVYLADATRAIKPRLRALVAEIGALQAKWPATEETIPQRGSTLEQIVGESLLGDRNRDPSLQRGVVSVLAQLGPKSNQGKLAKCLPTGVTDVEEFLSKFQRNVSEATSVTLSLEQLARLLNRYQGLLKYDPHRRTIKHGTPQLEL
jgi:hypothetical protein